MLVKIGKYIGNRNSGNIYTRIILTEIYHLSGMKSFRDELIDRMKTGWGRFVLASFFIQRCPYPCSEQRRPYPGCSLDSPVIESQ